MPGTTKHIRQFAKPRFALISSNELCNLRNNFVYKKF